MEILRCCRKIEGKWWGRKGMFERYHQHVLSNLLTRDEMKDKLVTNNANTCSCCKSILPSIEIHPYQNKPQSSRLLISITPKKPNSIRPSHPFHRIVSYIFSLNKLLLSVGLSCSFPLPNSTGLGLTPLNLPSPISCASSKGFCLLPISSSYLLSNPA